MLRRLASFGIAITIAITIMIELQVFSSTPVVAAPIGSNWNLIFNEDFNGSTLNTTVWNTCYWWIVNNGCSVIGNNELQWYQANDVLIENGMARLRAQRRFVNNYQYTSGMLTTEGKRTWQYGYFEARVRVPRGRGFWPAFWMMSQERHWPPEIDIMEHIGQDPNVAHMGHYWRDSNNNTQHSGVAYRGPDFTADFHTFAVLWERDLLVFYVDGVETHRTSTYVPNEPMYILLNLAVGGNWPGAPDATTPFPSTYDIDYVRIWQNTGTVPLPTLTPQPLPIVANFTLVNADTDTDIRPLNEGDVINLSLLPTQNLTIRANITQLPVGSVSLNMNNGQHVQMENVAPYSLYGELSNGAINNYNGFVPALGSYTLTVSPYIGQHGQGAMGTSRTVRFSVTRNNTIPSTATLIPATSTLMPPTATLIPPTSTRTSPTATLIPPTATLIPATGTPLPLTATLIPPTSTPLPLTATLIPPTSTRIPPTVTLITPALVSGASILNITLVNADTNVDIMTINNGDTINRLTLPVGQVTFRVNTQPSVIGSVVMNLNNGQRIQTENTAPYTLFGDLPGANGTFEYGGFNLPLGTLTLTVTAYTSANAQGTPSTPYTIAINVADR